jgi:hypothetical protein
VDVVPLITLLIIDTLLSNNHTAHHSDQPVIHICFHFACLTLLHSVCWPFPAVPPLWVGQQKDHAFLDAINPVLVSVLAGRVLACIHPSAVCHTTHTQSPHTAHIISIVIELKSGSFALRLSRSILLQAHMPTAERAELHV